MQYRPSMPFPMYHETSHEAPQPRRGRRPSARPAGRQQPGHQHDVRAAGAHSHPGQFDRRNAPEYRHLAHERFYAQHVEATMAAQRAAYQQLANIRAMQAVQPPRAHQAGTARAEASRLQLRERPEHNGEPPRAHQASTLQKMTYQQLADTGRMHTAHPTHNNEVPNSQIEAFHQHMHMERMRASQMPNIRTQTALHGAYQAIPLPASHTPNSQVDYQRHEATQMHTPYPSLPQQAPSAQTSNRKRRNQRVDPHTNKRPNIESAKKRIAPGVPNVYQPHGDEPVTPETAQGKRADQRPDHRQTQWPPFATHTTDQPKEDMLGASRVMYQPLTDTFATAHVAYQPNTQMYTKSEIIYQPRTNMLAAKQLVYQPGTDMIATAETVYRPDTNMMATRQTMFQPQDDTFRTKEAVYQPQADVLAMRETNFQYRKNVVNTKETIYRRRDDSDAETRMNSSQNPTNDSDKSVNEIQNTTPQTSNSEKSVDETQKTTPILRQILSLEQQQDELRTPSRLPNGHNTSEQNQQPEIIEVQRKTPRKSATPKKTLRQTRKRKLSTESEIPVSQALVPTQQNSLTGPEWLTRLESLARSRTRSPEQPQGPPAAKKPTGLPPAKRNEESPAAPQPELASARPPPGPLVVANYWRTQASTSNDQVNSYHIAS